MLYYYSMVVVFDIRSMLSADIVIGSSYRHCTRWPWETFQHSGISDDSQKNTSKCLYLYWKWWVLSIVGVDSLFSASQQTANGYDISSLQATSSQWASLTSWNHLMIYAGCLLWHSQGAWSKKLGQPRALQRWLPFPTNGCFFSGGFVIFGLSPKHMPAICKE